jgi:hypothetical protein
MGYRDHIVAKLSALAVAGGTTAMLFAATPVHTQFSATTNGSLSASGAKVALTITNGNLVATNLLPATTSATGSTTFYPTNSQKVTLTNSGSVPEDFSLNISQYNCGSLSALPTTGSGATLAGALDQLKIVYTLGSGSQQTVTPFNHFGALSCSSNGNNTPLGSTRVVPLGPSIPPNGTETATIQVELGAESQSSPDANDWNGATGVEIPYTIQAEPDDAAATPQTSAGPTLSGVVSTPAPKQLTVGP